MVGPFARRRGALTLRIGEAEAEILGQVVREMRAQVAAPDRAPHLYRLFPPAYTDDAEAQHDFARFTTDDLVAEKMKALDEVEHLLARGRERRGVWSAPIEHDEEHSLLVVLNDARLMLGTRLDVTEDSDASGDEPDESDPDAFALGVYHWLGWLQSFLVDELLRV